VPAFGDFTDEVSAEGHYVPDFIKNTKKNKEYSIENKIYKKRSTPSPK
jgi:hypothetical protein